MFVREGLGHMVIIGASQARCWKRFANSHVSLFNHGVAFLRVLVHYFVAKVVDIRKICSSIPYIFSSGIRSICNQRPHHRNFIYCLSKLYCFMCWQKDHVLVIMNNAPGSASILQHSLHLLVFWIVHCHAT